MEAVTSSIVGSSWAADVGIASALEEVATAGGKAPVRQDGVAVSRERNELESEASTEGINFSEASVSDMASSNCGDTTPRGGSEVEIKKPGHLPIRPRWSDMSVDEGVLDSRPLEQELLACPESPDCSPKSPTKGARRAQRRRRRREEAKAASMFDAPLGAAGADAAQLPGAVVGHMPAIQVMLPANALADGGINVKAVPIGNCTPTCVASPARASPTLPIACAGSRTNPVPCGAGPCSPVRRVSHGPGTGTFMAASPHGFMGDASTRTPTGACSPFMRGGVVLGTDASARTPTAGPRPGAMGPFGPEAMWTFVGSPNARAGLQNTGIVSTSPSGSANVQLGGSPVGSAHVINTSPVGSASGLGFQSPSAAAARCGHAGGPGGGNAAGVAAEALRALLGPAGVSDTASSSDLAAKLRAAAPHTYED